MDRNNKKATEEKELGTFTSIKTALFSQQIATRSEIHGYWITGLTSVRNGVILNGYPLHLIHSSPLQRFFF